ncbi:MAG: pyrrolo-quinoline quinone [Rhodospirillaceae bacterium]|mgnify:CR=1 FL=1|nr:pyrrolo-quinoline quinone [Rhodospirillaceae bacterium]|tara:strand:+ start:45908 stop:47221 length:1314 start_codon:yes stop_codon:yes gene_type:complete
MFRVFLVILTSTLLVNCGGWFGSKPQKPLPGKRISVLSLERSLEPDPKLSDLAVRLPRPFKNQNWAQAGGTPSHAMHHLSAAGGLGRLWEVDIGDGSDGDAQLITAPVISNGRVYTMDVEATVQALDAASGRTIWRVNVAPKDEDDGTLGGGLAVANGKLFITTGFAQVIALNAANGRLVWRRVLNGPLRAPPTVFKGRVFAVTIANELHALDETNGKTLWSHIGITESAGLLGGAAPAAAGSVVVSSFSSGEVFALRVENGRVIWSDTLTAIRRSSPLSTLAHIRGRPVIDRGQVIVTANSGRTVSINLRTGARVWEKRVGAGNGPWVAGEFVYVLSAFGELLCLSRRTGGVRWVTQLQRYEDEKDQEDPIFWTGPVLAGDRLLIGGSHEEVWSISPYTGKILGRVKLSGPVFIPPVIANDTVFILSDDARLIALR